MASFFPPAVVKTITNENAEAMLQPRTSQITVLFCDLRGFSRTVEQGEGDLPAILAKISEALSVMVRSIMEYGGVIADFQGDAALSFWGWPQPNPDGPLFACRAARAIHRQFLEANKTPGHALHGLQVGIGIGHGTGIAGQIGPPEMSKVGVFGGVVNLAARLQAMTREFRTPILLDQATALAINERGQSDALRCRRVACVQPKGMQSTLTVSELLVQDHAAAKLSDHQITLHEIALDMFIAGNWTNADEIFRTQLAHDEANSLLRDLITKRNQRPPEDWNGVVNFQTEPGN